MCTRFPRTNLKESKKATSKRRRCPLYSLPPLFYKKCWKKGGPHLIRIKGGNSVRLEVAFLDSACHLFNTVSNVYTYP